MEFPWFSFKQGAFGQVPARFIGPSKYALLPEKRKSTRRSSPKPVNPVDEDWIEIIRLLEPTAKVIKKGNWDPEEDEALKKIIQNHTHLPRDWPAIAAQMRNRNSKQCRERWRSCLSPEINREVWSFAEDMLVWSLQKKSGHCWAEIASHLPGRTESHVKRRFTSIQPAAKRFWKADEDAKLMELYEQLGSNWHAIAADFPGRTKNSVHLRYKQIKEGKVHEKVELGAPSQILSTVFKKAEWE